MSDLSSRLRKAIAGTAVGAGLVALMAVAMAGGSGGAQAAPVAPSDDTPTTTATSMAEATATSTPNPRPIPRPIRLRPWLQFGHAAPGRNADYTKLLFNHLTQQTNVSLSGDSYRNWNVTVNPSQTVALPGYANLIHISVHVPLDPDHRLDLERVRASVDGGTPYTTTAYLLTITRREIFSDLKDGDWADDPVQYLVDQGVVTGYSDGSFRPNAGVTRAQFAKMLVLAMGWQLQTPANPTFSDVPADNWAYSYIETAAAHGVIGGYADDTFRPGNNLTRAQVAKMVFSARGWTLDTATYTNFSDVAQVDWYYNYVQGMSSAEVMSGYSDNSFRPNAPATRGQVAKILTLSLFSDPNN